MMSTIVLWIRCVHENILPSVWGPTVKNRDLRFRSRSKRRRIGLQLVLFEGYIRRGGHVQPDLKECEWLSGLGSGLESLQVLSIT
jgi:hypothetical protein